MSSDGGLEDFSLMDLFRSEVETHSEVLSSALLALERSPDDTSRVDEMMRAAHSIKGAARVVGVDPAVSVAHVMEDCFVAAQRGKLTLTPSDVDVLLRGVDLLGKISEATRDAKIDPAAEFDVAVQALVGELEAMLHPELKPAPSPLVPESVQPPPQPATASEPETIEPGSDTITFPEWLDASAAEDARGQFLEAIERGCDPIRLDLRATKDLDIQGLILLAAIPRHLARHGGPKVRIEEISPELLTVLEVTGLVQVYGSQGHTSGDR
ncbi:MAG: Hpt domain-containing protein [Isosphaeraceae bacterium]